MICFSVRGFYKLSVVILTPVTAAVYVLFSLIYESSLSVYHTNIHKEVTVCVYYCTVQY